jgi:hypothetical protein
MTDNEAIQFVKDVIAGSRAITSAAVVNLSSDPNPEWFCGYDGIMVKMHTSPSRETLSGVKLKDSQGERSFFNLGMTQALKGGVGPRAAVDNHQYAFAAWTAGLTWDQARQFLNKILTNCKQKSPPLRRT